MKELKAVAKEVITHLVDAPCPDSYGWPPVCNAILYQPERPVMESAADNEAEGE